MIPIVIALPISRTVGSHRMRTQWPILNMLSFAFPLVKFEFPVEIPRKVRFLSLKLWGEIRVEQMNVGSSWSTPTSYWPFPLFPMAPHYASDFTSKTCSSVRPPTALSMRAYSHIPVFTGSRISWSLLSLHSIMWLVQYLSSPLGGGSVRTRQCLSHLPCASEAHL